MYVAQNVRLDNGKPDKIISGPSGQYYNTVLLSRFPKTYITQELKLLFGSPGACNALNKL